MMNTAPDAAEDSNASLGESDLEARERGVAEREREAQEIEVRLKTPEETTVYR